MVALLLTMSRVNNSKFPGEKGRTNFPIEFQTVNFQTIKFLLINLNNHAQLTVYLFDPLLTRYKEMNNLLMKIELITINYCRLII